MAEEGQAQEVQTDESQQQEKDYKAMYEAEKAEHEKAVAESRKWESRSKANAEAAKKLEELTAGETSVEDRISKLEAANKALEDEKARNALVAKVAASTGLSEAIVSTLNGQDEKSLIAQAQAIAELKPKGAPTAPEAGKFPKDPAKSEQLEFVRTLLGKN